MVYFQPGYEPGRLGLGRFLLPAQFEYEVYRAGGYEDLVKAPKA